MSVVRWQFLVGVLSQVCHKLVFCLGCFVLSSNLEAGDVSLDDDEFFGGFGFRVGLERGSFVGFVSGCEPLRCLSVSGFPLEARPRPSLGGWQSRPSASRPFLLLQDAFREAQGGSSDRRPPVLLSVDGALRPVGAAPPLRVEAALRGDEEVLLVVSLTLFILLSRFPVVCCRCCCRRRRFASLFRFWLVSPRVHVRSLQRELVVGVAEVQEPLELVLVRVGDGHVLCELAQLSAEELYVRDAVEHDPGRRFDPVDADEDHVHGVRHEGFGYFEELFLFVVAGGAVVHRLDWRHHLQLCCFVYAVRVGDD